MPIPKQKLDFWLNSYSLLLRKNPFYFLPNAITVSNSQRAVTGILGKLKIMLLDFLIPKPE